MASTNPYFIIDFDSTFIKVEALDELAKRVLKDNPDRETIQAEIQEITRQAMNGEIPFRESLAQRLYLFKPTRQDIADMVPYLKRIVTASVRRNKAFFKEHAERIYIMSGGFEEYIIPVVNDYGIPADHVLANTFQYSGEVAIGFNDKKPLSRNKGKIKAVKSLKLDGRVIVIGDGYTDLEIKLGKAADRFYAFTENIRREAVVSKADREIPNFDELLYTLKIPASVSYPKNRIKALLLEKVDPLAVEALKSEGYEVETLAGALGEQELAERIADVSILGIRSKTMITRKVLGKANKLLAIGAFCIGTNQIDLEAAANRGIAVFNAPYSNTRSVVELALGEMLVLMRKVFEKSVKLHAGVWDKNAAGSREIRGKKLGIVGYGNIGSQLSVVAEALGMEVYFYDIVEKLALGNAKKCDTLTDLLKRVDVVSIHVDGRPENTNMIGAKEFAIMRKGVVFVNSSRGHVVDVTALAEAVRSGKIGGAAIDVFPYEPKSNDERFVSELQGLPNTILTPHIGGSTEEAQRNIAAFVSDRLLRFVNAGDTTLSVNFPQMSLPPQGNVSRFIHIHKNVPGILAQINGMLAQEKINVEGQYLKTDERIGYVIVDVDRKHSSRLAAALKKIPDTIRVRTLY